jgi:hypothetical protein
VPTPKTRRRAKPEPPAAPAPRPLSHRLLVRTRELLRIAAPTDSGIPRNEVRFLRTCERYLMRRLAR